MQSATPAPARSLRQWFCRFQWLRFPCLVVVALVLALVVGFALGYWISNRRLDAKAYEMSEMRFAEMIVNFDRLGLIDHAKLDEIIQERQAIQERADAETAKVIEEL